MARYFFNGDVSAASQRETFAVFTDQALTAAATDLLSENGSAVTVVTRGMDFYGPDGVTTLWGRVSNDTNIAPVRFYATDAPASGTSVQTWRTVVNNGTATPVGTATAVTVTTNVLPSTVDVPVEVGACATVLATADATNIYLTVTETSNGTDTPVNVSAFLPSLANGTGITLSLPDEALYITATGRARTLIVQVYATTGSLSVLNSAQFPTVLRARSA